MIKRPNHQEDKVIYVCAFKNSIKIHEAKIGRIKRINRQSQLKILMPFY